MERTPRSRASSIAAFVSCSPTRARASVVDDDVLDPRAPTSGDREDDERQRADDRRLLRGDEERGRIRVDHALDVLDRERRRLR